MQNENLQLIVEFDMVHINVCFKPLGIYTCRSYTQNNLLTIIKIIIIIKIIVISIIIEFSIHYVFRCIC